MRLILLSAVAVVKILLCKAISLILLCGWFMQQYRHSGTAGRTISTHRLWKKMQAALVWIYGIASVLSSAVSCSLMRRMRFRHSLLLAAALWAGGAAGTCWRWKNNRNRQQLLRLLYRAEQDSRRAERSGNPVRR